MPYTEAECLTALQDAVDELGYAPTVAEYDALDYSPSWNTIQHRCGGWTAALEKIDVERAPRRQYTKQDCLDVLQKAADELGEEPVFRTYRTLGLNPAASTIASICGSWSAAKEEAGVTE